MVVRNALTSKYFVVFCCVRSYEDLDEAIDEGDVRSEGGRLPISYEQAFSLQHR